jgi:hypothetical protein
MYNGAQIFTLLLKLVEAGNSLEPCPVEGGHRTWGRREPVVRASGPTTKMEVVWQIVWRLCL